MLLYTRKNARLSDGIVIYFLDKNDLMQNIMMQYKNINILRCIATFKNNVLNGIDIEFSH